MASDDAETLDIVIRGTEEQLERKNAVVFKSYAAKVMFLFVAYVKRWWQDGKGLMASK